MQRGLALFMAFKREKRSNAGYGDDPRCIQFLPRLPLVEGGLGLLPRSERGELPDGIKLDRADEVLQRALPSTITT